MSFRKSSKPVSIIATTLILVVVAAGQASAAHKNCQAIGGMILTNLNAFGPNTTMGVATGDLAGAVGVEILGTTVNNGVVDVSVQHHWVTNTGETLVLDKADAFGVYVGPGLLAVTKYEAHLSGGTGKYQNAAGDLTFIGEGDFGAGHLVLRYSGEICYDANER